MSTSFNNIALFIKRAEEYQTKEFISEKFETYNIGKVRDIKFIKKNNDMGVSYNGAIVIFERWNMNSFVETLFNKMSSSPDGTTRFYFENNRYWIINVHKQQLPECQEQAIVVSSLSDKEKIKELESLVKSMSAQMCYYQNRQEKSERNMMELEFKETHHHLVNTELRYKLDEKDWQKQWAEDEFKAELKKLRDENNILKSEIALNAIVISRKDEEIENLKRDNLDNTCIILYLENQRNEMKKILQNVSELDPIKHDINKYVNEYLS